MQTLQLTSTQDRYVDALTLGPIPTGEQVSFLVANASVYVQIADKNDDQTIGDWGPDILVTPSSGTFVKATGIRFRSAIAGTPAVVTAQLIQPQDPRPIGATPFTQALTAQGGVSDKSVITGSVAANGTIVAGTGFTVPSHPSAGVYVVSFSTPFAIAPVVLVEELVTTVTDLIWGVQPTPGGCTFYGRSVTVGAQDRPFNFTAEAIA